MIKPVQNIVQAPASNASLTRYGVFMGGPKSEKWEPIGDSAIGIQGLVRRELLMFTDISVGRRNDLPEALEANLIRLHEGWHVNPDRVVTKSALECVQDVQRNYTERGFVVLNSLTGLQGAAAEAIFDTVLPKAVRESSLVECIDYLSRSSLDGIKDQLRNELLEGAAYAKTWMTEHIRGTKVELEIAKGTGKGKRGVDSAEREYFIELNEILPENVPAQATMALGKEIAAAMPKSGGNDEILRALVEQNKLLLEQTQLLKGQQAQTQATNGTTEKSSVGTIKKDK